MKRNFAKISLLLCLSPAWCAAQSGTVTGKLELPSMPSGRVAVEKYAGSISGKVGPMPKVRAGVWLEGQAITAPARIPEVIFTQKDYQFSNSLIVIPRGTTVIFPNEDPDFHNIFSLSKTTRFDLGRYKQGENPAPKHTFVKAGLVKLQCEIHEHMKATIIVVESPHYTTTAADGSFQLKGLPIGNWTLRAQLDATNQWHAPVTIQSGKTLQVQLQRGAPK